MYEDIETQLSNWSCCESFKQARISDDIAFKYGAFFQKDEELGEERVMIDYCPFCNKRLISRYSIVSDLDKRNVA